MEHQNRPTGLPLRRKAASPSVSILVDRANNREPQQRMLGHFTP
jgi:hypothetical protein